MNGCGKWELNGKWPVQSKRNYPKLNFIPFDMEHQFGDAEIGGICRENIVYIILNANHNTLKGQLRAKFCLPQCCQWCPRLLPKKCIVTDDPGSKPDQRYARRKDSQNYIRIFHVLLTVHSCIICFKWSQLGAHCFLVDLFQLLYMFRATMCLSSGELTLSKRNWYFSLCMGGCLLCCRRPDSHPYRTKTTSVA